MNPKSRLSLSPEPLSRTWGSSLSSEVQAAKLISGVYAWMAGGVALTALSAFALVSSGVLQSLFVNYGRAAMWGVLIVQLGLVFSLSLLAEKLSVTATRAMFLAYSAITGITVGALSMVYTAASMSSIFAVAAAGFAGLAVFGYTTKRDLGVFKTFLIMGLFMVIGLSLVNLFVQSATVSYVGSAMGVLVFSGLTAWESQRIRQTAFAIGGRGEVAQKFVVQGALIMYLNFINLFLSLLNLFGQRRD